MSTVPVDVASRLRPAPVATAAVERDLVLAREISAQPGTTVLIIDHAQGEQCAWCDCPTGLDAPHGLAEAECGGCMGVAECVVRVVQAGEDRWAIPACSRHLAETARTIALMAALPV